MSGALMQATPGGHNQEGPHDHSHNQEDHHSHSHGHGHHHSHSHGQGHHHSHSHSHGNHSHSHGHGHDGRDHQDHAPSPSLRTCSGSGTSTALHAWRHCSSDPAALGEDEEAPRAAPPTVLCALPSTYSGGGWAGGGSGGSSSSTVMATCAHDGTGGVGGVSVERRSSGGLRRWLGSSRSSSHDARAGACVQPRTGGTADVAATLGYQVKQWRSDLMSKLAHVAQQDQGRRQQPLASSGDTCGALSSPLLMPRDSPFDGISPGFDLDASAGSGATASASNEDRSGGTGAAERPRDAGGGGGAPTTLLDALGTVRRCRSRVASYAGMPQQAQQAQHAGDAAAGHSRAVSQAGTPTTRSPHGSAAQLQALNTRASPQAGTPSQSPHRAAAQTQAQVQAQPQPHPPPPGIPGISADAEGSRRAAGAPRAGVTVQGLVVPDARAAPGTHLRPAGLARPTPSAVPGDCTEPAAQHQAQAQQAQQQAQLQAQQQAQRQAQQQRQQQTAPRGRAAAYAVEERPSFQDLLHSARTGGVWACGGAETEGEGEEEADGDGDGADARSRGHLITVRGGSTRLRGCTVM
ncbi:hypothetical protein FOA52_015405 [Chlamydomonas sp. UWO 241]|nr:hypothetical protein FOA52_015405 [Chlamydomonas sp. UWO 241]